jgi:branched-chain amino acid transport system permease protein
MTPSLRHPLLATSAACLSAVVVAAASWLNSYYLYLANLTLVNAIVAIGLVVLSGIAGQLSLGASGLVAVGAYVAGAAMVHLGCPFWLAAMLGVGVTTMIGTLLAAPALRLTGLHLAIVTLAFGIVVVQLIGKGGKLTGGMGGLTIPATEIFGWELDTEWRRFVVISAVFSIVVAATLRLLASKTGRALLAIRERELAARSLGIDTAAYKTLAFAYSSSLCGLAGALYAIMKGFISVDDFTVWQSIYYFMMIAIGGMTSVAGGVLGAIFVTVVPEALREFPDASQAVFGIIFFLIVVFLPAGIVSLVRPFRSRFARVVRPIVPNDLRNLSIDHRGRHD